MSHTNVTPNFDLPQFTADDKPDWLVDVNAAFLAIDTGMEATQSEAESASSTAQLAQETAENASETAGQASSDVAGLTTDLETLQGTVNTVTALIGNGTPTTTDKTIIGAINELADLVEGGSEVITSATTDADVSAAILTALQKGRQPYIVAEYTSGGHTFKNVIFRFVQSGFDATTSLTFTAVIDSNNIRVIYIDSNGTAAQDASATLGAMKLYH